MSMARRGSKRDHGKEQFWRRMVRLWRQSELSARAFCAEHGLAEPSFYAWRRILVQRDLESGPTPAKAEQRRACRDKPAKSDAPVFVPLRVIDAAAPAALEVV